MDRLYLHAFCYQFEWERKSYSVFDDSLRLFEAIMKTYRCPEILKNYIIELMRPLEKKDFFEKKQNLNVVLISGVNGVGKTTSIGKIGKI